MTSGLPHHTWLPDQADASPPPSWIRLLDSPRGHHDLDPGSPFRHNAPPVKNPPPPADDTISVPELGSGGEGEGGSLPWYMSPFFNKPVIGYYNRVTQSNLSLASPPLGETFGFPADNTGSGGGGGGGSGGLKGETNRRRSSLHAFTPQDHSVYSELGTPWLSGSKPLDGGPAPAPTAAATESDFPARGARDNPAFLLPGTPGGGEGYASVGRGSRAREPSPLPLPPGGVLKPEEYLNGLQREVHSSQAGGHGQDQCRGQGRVGPCGPCSRLVPLTLALMALTIVALATALTVSVLTQPGGTGSESAQGGYPVVRAAMTLKILNKNFSSDMAQPGSDLFTSVAVPYSTELDRLFLTSPLANVYRGNKVTALGPGSISARTELLFLDTGLVTKGEAVEAVIRSAERASQWNERDARAMGQFVVCADCVTVNLNFTRLPQLPPLPVLQSSGSEESVPVSTTSTQTPVTQAGGDATENTTVSTPNIVVSNSTPFLSDGYFVITCDVTNATGWSLLTLKFRADNSSVKSWTILVTVRPDSPSVAETATSRLSAYPVASSDQVSLVVNVTDVTCADRGDYLCGVKMSSGQELSASGHIGLLELPSVPEIRHTWSSTAWDATPVYRCTARLGYPPGALSFSVSKDKHSPWERLAMTDVSEGEGCRGESSIGVSALHPAFLSLEGRNGSRLLCRVFSEHLQLIDPGDFSAVIHLRPVSKLEIQTKSTSVGQGLAAIRCRLLLLPGTAWSRLTLLKMTSQGQKEVTSLGSDGSVTWADHYLRHRTLMTTNVTEAVAELSLFIFSLKCADEGVYACSISPSANISRPQAPLNVTAKPSNPDLSVPANIFQHSQYPVTITCKAKVGRPAGNLVLAVKHPNEVDFRELHFNEQTTIPLSCTTEARGTFYASARALHNGSSVACSVKPHPTLGAAEAGAYDGVRVFSVLSDVLCRGQPETNVSHPTDCRHVIYCRNDVIVSVHKCPGGFCFEETSKSCRLPDAVHSHREPTHGPCYPDKDQVTLPHPAQCTTFLQCHRGHEVTQHCLTAHLYVTRRQCSNDVTQTLCYKQLDRETGVVTNTTALSTLLDLDPL